MEQHFLDALYLIGCAVRGKRAVLREDMNFDLILHECYGQSCDLWAIDALLNAKNAEILDNTTQLRTFLLKTCAKETLRRVSVDKMLRNMEENGFKPILIKGDVLADLYPNPILRKSVDTDLFFQSGSERDAAGEFLVKTGGVGENLSGEGKHSAVKYPGAGRIELHKSLYDEDFHKLHLKGDDIIKEPLCRMKNKRGCDITTLGKTDSLKYVFCHMMGHFLFSRCDIRQMCDILMYVKTYRDEADKEELLSFLKKTGYYESFATVMGVGVEFLGFDKRELFDLKYSKKTVELFLTDCFNGCTKGVWGKTSQPRGVGLFSYEFTGKKFSRGKSPARAIKRVLMPGTKLLGSLYPYCEKRSFLIPAAWVNNITDVAKGLWDNRNKLKSRESLLKRMGVLK